MFRTELCEVGFEYSSDISARRFWSGMPFVVLGIHLEYQCLERFEFLIPFDDKGKMS